MLHFIELLYTKLCGNSFSGYREHSQSSVYIMDRTIQGLIPSKGRGIFSSAKHPEQHCSPPILLLTWVTGVPCQWTEQSRYGKLTTHLHLVLRLRNSGVIPLLPLSTCTVWVGTTLTLLGCQDL
jgi:hypothetical protein